jgi:hypothetical protein
VIQIAKPLRVPKVNEFEVGQTSPVSRAQSLTKSNHESRILIQAGNRRTRRGRKFQTQAHRRGEMHKLKVRPSRAMKSEPNDSARKQLFSKGLNAVGLQKRDKDLNNDERR